MQFRSFGIKRRVSRKTGREMSAQAESCELRTLLCAPVVSGGPVDSLEPPVDSNVDSVAGVAETDLIDVALIDSEVFDIMSVDNHWMPGPEEALTFVVGDSIPPGDGDGPVGWPSDGPTDGPVDWPTDGPVEWPSDAPTDGQVDGPVDWPSDGPTDGPVDSSSDGPFEKVIVACDGPTDGPVENVIFVRRADPDGPTDAPVDWPTDGPTDVPVGWPSDGPTDVPVDWPSDKPVDLPTDVPIEVPFSIPYCAAVWPTDVPIEVSFFVPYCAAVSPVDWPTDVQVDGTWDVPSDGPVDSPFDEPMDGPVEDYYYGGSYEDYYSGGSYEDSYYGDSYEEYYYGDSYFEPVDAEVAVDVDVPASDAFDPLPLEDFQGEPVEVLYFGDLYSETVDGEVAVEVNKPASDPIDEVEYLFDQVEVEDASGEPVDVVVDGELGPIRTLESSDFDPAVIFYSAAAGGVEVQRANDNGGVHEETAVASTVAIPVRTNASNSLFNSESGRSLVGIPVGLQTTSALGSNASPAKRNTTQRRSSSQVAATRPSAASEGLDSLTPLLGGETGPGENDSQESSVDPQEVESGSVEETVSDSGNASSVASGFAANQNFPVHNARTAMIDRVMAQYAENSFNS